MVEQERKDSVKLVDANGQQKYPGGRTVFQIGIEILDHAALPWHDCPMMASGYSQKDIDAKNRPAFAPNWAEIPPGSIVVIDEAWRYFPVRAQGAGVPPYVQFLAEHRHSGIDVVMVTQSVKQQIDTFVRGLVQRHIHLVRKYGAESSEIYQWEQLSDVTSTKAKEKAIKTDWSFPKEIYAWYKSAEVHTVKKDFPWRKFWFIPPLVIVVAFLVYYAIHRVLHLRDYAAGGAPPSAGVAGAPGVVGAVGNLPVWWRPHAAVPRDDLLPGSAPRYDGVFKVVTAPIVSGCMRLDIGGVVQCHCTNQAGAVVAVTTAECMSLVRVGWFDPSQHYPDAKQENIEFLKSFAGKMAPADEGSGGPQRSSGASGSAGSSPASSPNSSSERH